MTISEVLDHLYKEAENLGIDLNDTGFSSDEDVQIFALRFLLANLEDAIDWGGTYYEDIQ